jgi:hypothetical protein
MKLIYFQETKKKLFLMCSLKKTQTKTKKKQKDYVNYLLPHQ